MSHDWPVETGALDLSDLPVERGGAIRGARLGWQAHGQLSASGHNAVVVPTSSTATRDEAWLVGPDGVLDRALVRRDRRPILGRRELGPDRARVRVVRVRGRTTRS